MNHATQLAAPVSQSERIVLLDSLRGFAILGILLMNIPGFSLPGPVGSDPSVLNETGSVNYYTWYIISFLFDGTQRALFSMLFGAGILLFISRQEKKSAGIEPADYFFRRQLWLMVFSLFDAYILLWFGDILFDYACLGMIMFAFRKWSPKALILGAVVCLFFMTARENRDLYKHKQTIQKGEVVAKLDTSITKLTDKQSDELTAMKELKERSTRESKLKRMKKIKESTLGSYAELYETRSNSYVQGLMEYLYYGFWDVLIFMFLGMAFFKSGILTGNASVRVYWGLFLGGMSIGLTLSYLRLEPFLQYQFNWFQYARNVKFEYYEIARTFRSLGLFGFIMLLYKSGWFKWLFSLMQPVGQMAFTNYLMQSLFCGIIFYGIGFGQFGQMQRHEIYYVVAVIWIFQIIFCHIWMKFFLYGPFEWAWRSLTYWKKQPFLQKEQIA